MVSYNLHFDLQAFGTPEDWNARSSYATWNRRQALQYEPGPVPVTPCESLSDFDTLLDCRSDSEGLPLSRRFGSALEVEPQWLQAGMACWTHWSLSVGCGHGTGLSWKLFSPK